MKTILEEAMSTYVSEMNKTSDLINEEYSKATKAAHRGDNLNYRRHSNTIRELGEKLKEMRSELEQIKAAYAAI